MVDLFFIISDIDIASYADDNPPHIAAGNTDILSNHWKKHPLPYFTGLIVIF